MHTVIQVPAPDRVNRISCISNQGIPKREPGLYRSEQLDVFDQRERAKPAMLVRALCKTAVELPYHDALRGDMRGVVP